MSIDINLDVLSEDDFASDQEVRWCPGCGDHAILTGLRSAFARLGVPREKTVVVSGIGCSSRLPYYLDTYGMHSIHGRAPSIATGISINRPDLSVWVITGDGDALSIGGNHLIHALRRNVNLKILLFDNRIYGLTKGQASPTSAAGTVGPSSPAGSLDNPFNPIALALGAGATFVARTVDSDRQHLAATLDAAAAHTGTALVHIRQSCPTFNPTPRAVEGPGPVKLVPGEPIVFGEDDELAIVRDAQTGELSVGEPDDPRVVVHDPTTPNVGYAFALAGLADTLPDSPLLGVLRAVRAPTLDELFQQRLVLPKPDVTHPESTYHPGDLGELLTGTDSWRVG